MYAGSSFDHEDQNEHRCPVTQMDTTLAACAFPGTAHLLARCTSSESQDYFLLTRRSVLHERSGE
jgi:hypothetical protein